SRNKVKDRPSKSSSRESTQQSSNGGWTQQVDSLGSPASQSMGDDPKQVDQIGSDQQVDINFVPKCKTVWFIKSVISMCVCATFSFNIILCELACPSGDLRGMKIARAELCIVLEKKILKIAPGRQKGPDAAGIDPRADDSPRGARKPITHKTVFPLAHGDPGEAGWPAPPSLQRPRPHFR
ncbi:Protein of unknown function, partial [Gryllus bimaculatus]